MKKIIAMSALMLSCTTLSAGTGQTQEDMSICFQPFPVNSVQDLVDGTSNFLACVARELVG